MAGALLRGCSFEIDCKTKIDALFGVFLVLRHSPGISAGGVIHPDSLPFPGYRSKSRRPCGITFEPWHLGQGMTCPLPEFLDLRFRQDILGCILPRDVRTLTV